MGASPLGNRSGSGYQEPVSVQSRLPSLPAAGIPARVNPPEVHVLEVFRHFPDRVELLLFVCLLPLYAAAVVGEYDGRFNRLAQPAGQHMRIVPAPPDVDAAVLRAVEELQGHARRAQRFARPDHGVHDLLARASLTPSASPV